MLVKSIFGERNVFDAVEQPELNQFKKDHIEGCVEQRASSRHLGCTAFSA